MRSRALRIAGFLIILLPFMYASARRVREDVATARRFRSLPWEERQRATYGEWFRTVQQVRRTVPENEPVDIIMQAPNACAAYSLAFAVTSWNIAGLANVSADRLLLHLAGAAAIVVIDTFRK